MCCNSFCFYFSAFVYTRTMHDACAHANFVGLLQLKWLMFREWHVSGWASVARTHRVHLSKNQLRLVKPVATENIIWISMQWFVYVLVHSSCHYYYASFSLFSFNSFCLLCSTRDKKESISSVEGKWKWYTLCTHYNICNSADKSIDLSTIKCWCWFQNWST